MYRIASESIFTGYKNYGEYCFQTKEDAEKAISLIQEKNPYVKHWVEKKDKPKGQNKLLK